MKKENKDIEIIETSATVIEEEVKENKFKNLIAAISDFFKKLGGGKIRNQALLKRGSYSLIITALVLAAVFLFNWLVSSLSNRFNLEYDMTIDKKNSISAENLEYIKNLDADVTVTICATEDQYVDYMYALSQQYYGVYISSYDELEYFSQTVTLLEKYPSYNDRITVKYIDPQSSEFTAVTANHPEYSFTYGDMIVTSTVNGNERIKVLRFDDIYVTSQDSSNSYYGYSSSTLSANRLESALTSAIAYVTNADSKTAAVLSGHSNNTFTAAYIELLELNNYEITEIPDKLITSISDDFDIVVIAAPTLDFIDSELDVLSAFLDNNGKLGKGLVFFADATCPALPDLYAFLKQWGIEVEEGILYGTDGKSNTPSSPTILYSDPVALSDDDITESMLTSYAATGYNAPMKVGKASTYEREVTALMQTGDSVVISPIGAPADWADYTDDDKQQFDTVIQSKEIDFDSEGNEISSYVMAFASVEFVQSEWASYYGLCNQNIVMAATDRAAHVDDTSMIFTAKVIQNQNFADKITAENLKTVNTIFMFIIPIATIVLGIVIFVRRRNAR